MPSFQVDTESQDGYLQFNSNTLGRLNMNVRQLPLPLDIFTEEFVEDIGALTIQEALQFTAGLETDLTFQAPGENAGPTGYRLRGYVSNRALRNGFVKLGRTDTFNIAQVDVARGPMALLYGIGNFGGVVNYITHSPSEDDRYEARSTFGSNNFIRGEVNATGPIYRDEGRDNNRNVLGYYVAGYAYTRGAWFNNAEEEGYGFAPVIEWSPLEDTTINVEVEYLYREAARVEDPISPAFLISENDLDYVRTDIYPAVNLDGNAQTQAFFTYGDDETRILGPDSYTRNQDLGGTITLTQKISDNISLEAAYYVAETRSLGQNPNLNIARLDLELGSDSEAGRRNRDLYPWAFNNKDYRYADLNDQFTDGGEPSRFSIFSTTWGQSIRTDRRYQSRLQVATTGETDLPLVGPTTHLLLTGLTYSRYEVGDSSGFRLVDSSPDRADERRSSFNQSNLNVFPTARPQVQSIQDLTPIGLVFRDFEFFEQSSEQEPTIFWERGAYVIHQGTWLDGALTTFSGARYDWINTAGPLYEDNTGAFTGEYRYRADGPTDQFNFSFGASYRVSDAFNLFVLTASALEPIYNQTMANGRIPDPIQGQSREVGIKFDLFRDDKDVPRLSGMVAIYHVEKEGLVIDGGARAYGGEPAFTTERDDPIWNEQGRGNSSNKVFQDDQSQGVDAQFFLTNLVPHTQIVIGGSYNKYEIIDKYGPSYNPVESRPGQGIYVFDDVDFSDDIETRIKGNGAPDWTFRFWGKYSVPEDVSLGSLNLDGFEFGLGYSWSSKREAILGGFLDGPGITSSFKIIEPRHEVSGLISYKRKIYGTDMRFQLNISNLLDEDEINGYNYRAPRSFRFSVNAKF